MKQQPNSLIKITFTQNSDNKSRCVYWDLEKVDWSSDNCSTQELDGGRVQCVCNHLTSFAILMVSG